MKLIKWELTKVEIKPTHSGLRNVTDGESHIHIHLCTAQSTRRFSRLVPFCLLPFRLLKIKLCHFAYSTFNLTLIDLFSILTFDVFSSYTDI